MRGKKWCIIFKSFRREERQDAKWGTARNIVHNIRARPFPPLPRGIVSQGSLFRGIGSIWEPRRCSWHLAGIQLNIDPAPFSASKQLCTLINAPALSAQSNRIVLECAASARRGSSISRDICSSLRSNRSILIKTGASITRNREMVVKWTMNEIWITWNKNCSTEG